MKTKITLLAMTFLISLSTFAQQGINYKALIKDNLGNVVANQTISVQFSVLEDATVVYTETHAPTTNANGLIILNIGLGTTTDNFTDINWGNNDHFLKTEIDVSGGTTYTDMGTTQFMAVPYALNAANVTGLEAIDEGNGIGWRLKGRDPANHANIGVNAIDLSISTIASEVYGASGIYALAMGINVEASGNYASAMGFRVEASGNYTTARGSSAKATNHGAIAMGSAPLASGENSIAMGYYSIASGENAIAMGRFPEASGDRAISIGENTRASAKNSFAIGNYNIGGGNATDWIQTDPLFEIGNGVDVPNRSNALTILKNGTITAPSFDLAEITDAKSLITKEYADTNLVSSGLETLDEGNGIGYRIKGRNPANYGNIGLDAIDLSISSLALGTYGATNEKSVALGTHTTSSGYASTAIGHFTTASSLQSTAMGDYTISSGLVSTAMGRNTKALADFSTSMGKNTKAEALSNTAIGQYNIGGGDLTDWVETDPIFEVGNGDDDANRDNAITVLKNGKVGIGNNQPDGFLEVKAVNSGGQPNLNLIHEGTTGARINFSNTDTTNGNVWTIYGDTNDTDANSIFNIFHPNAPSNGNILQLRGNGRVGVNGAPNTEFHVYHGTNAGSDGFELSNTGSNTNFWRMYVNNTTGRLHLYSKSQGTTSIGDFNEATGAYSSTSDRRLKRDFQPLPFTWDNFMKLETLSYLYKAQKDNKRSLGLVAQDVEPIYPELVTYNTVDDVYHLNYSGFGVIAIKAIQEQQKVILSQQSRIEALEAKLIEKDNAYNTLSNRIETIESLLNTTEK